MAEILFQPMTLIQKYLYLLEDFLEWLSFNMYRKEIEAHFKKEYPREGCGILCIQNSRLKWVPCINLSEGTEDFRMDPDEYLSISLTSEILAIVHSHPDGSPEPSDYDRKNCNAMGIPYYIFSYPDMQQSVLRPE